MLHRIFKKENLDSIYKYCKTNIRVCLTSMEFMVGEGYKFARKKKRCLRVYPKSIEIESLQERRDHTDLVETHKFIKGKYKTPATKFFTKSNTQHSRGHSEKLFKLRCRLDVGKHHFCHRGIDNWNNLPEEAVSAETEKIFKKRLQRAVADA